MPTPEPSRSASGKRPRPAWAATLGLLAASLLVALALAEALLWALDLPPSGPFLQEFYGDGFKLMAYDRNPAGVFDIDLRDPATRGAWAARLADTPFAREWAATPFAVEVRLNSLGHRDAEPAPKAPGVRRIVAVGDSFTYGHGLPAGRSWPRQLEALLAARAGGPVEVYNAGVGGLDLRGIVPLAERMLDELDPDVLIYAYHLNDPLDKPPREGAAFDGPWRSQERAPGHFRLGAEPVEGLRTWALLRRALRQRRLTASMEAWYRDAHRPAAWARSGAAIARLAREAEARGVRFVLVAMPLVAGLDGRYPFEGVHARLAAFAREEDIEFVDALDALRGIPDEELLLHPRDRHPSPTYARRVAERLAEVLAAAPGGE